MAKSSNNKVTLARLEERIIAMQGDLKEVKVEVSRIQGCITGTEIFSRTTRTMLTGHLKEEAKKMAGWGIGVSIIAIIVSIIMRLMLK